MSEHQNRGDFSDKNSSCVETSEIERDKEHAGRCRARGGEERKGNDRNL